MMKQYFAFLLITISILLSAQSPRENLERDFTHFRKILIKWDADSIVYYLPPQVFNTVSQEQARRKYAQLPTSSKIGVTILESEIHAIGEILKTDSAYYAIIDAKTVRELDFGNKVKDFPGSLARPLIENKYGKENIQDTDVDNVFIVTSVYPVYATSEDGIHWKFMDDLDMGKKKIMARFFPMEQMKKPE